MRSTRTSRRLWPWLATAVVVTGALLAGLASTGTGTARFDQSAAEAVPQAPAVDNGVVERADLTAADEALADVISAGTTTLFGEGSVAADPVEEVYPRVISTCEALTVGPSSAVARTGQADGFGQLIQLWAMPAGAGTFTVTQMRRDLAECSKSPKFLTDVEAGAAWFTATTTSPGQVVTWFVFSRGDVVASLAFTGERVAPATVVRDAASRLNDLLSTALDGVCVNQSPTDQDSTRNPYLGAYVPYARAVTFKVSPTRVATPTADLSDLDIPDLDIPAAVEHPELAPVLTLTADLWTDGNGDGVRELAPPLDDATRGTAPLFADVEDFTADVSDYTDPGPAPVEPDTQVGAYSDQLPDVDVDGPGCGWAFTGQEPPAVDEVTIRAAAQVGWHNAVSRAVTRRYEAWVAHQQWVATYLAWARADAVYAPVREYLAAKDAAQLAAADAASAYDASRTAYLRALTSPPDAVAPTATPVPAVTPTQAPTQAPTATPTPTVTPTTEGTH